MLFLGFQKCTDQYQNVIFMISLSNKMFCIWIELGKAFANGHNSMSSFFFFFCYGGSSLKIHKTYLNNLHCFNSLGTIVKVKKSHSYSGNRRNMLKKKKSLLELLALNSRFSLCMYLHFNVGLCLSILCCWFPILRCWIDSGIICCLINSEPFQLLSVEKEPLVFSMLASH